MKMLNEAELERIAGGILPLFTLGPTYEPAKTVESGDGSGGVTYTW